VWFLSSAWAQYVGGIIAGIAGTETVAGAALDPRAALESSTGVFRSLGLIAIGIGVGLSAASFLLKRLAHEDKVDRSPSAAARAASDPAAP
jgi:POT family proton-dependent oligopeptide transporter